MPGALGALDGPLQWDRCLAPEAIGLVDLLGVCGDVCSNSALRSYVWETRKRSGVVETRMKVVELHMMRYVEWQGVGVKRRVARRQTFPLGNHNAERRPLHGNDTSSSSLLLFPSQLRRTIAEPRLDWQSSRWRRLAHWTGSLGAKPIHWRNSISLSPPYHSSVTSRQDQ